MATIGKTIQIRGDVTGAEDLVIEGEVEGTVKVLEHQVVIASGGAVRGDLHVASVQINGRLKGNVFATERVELGESAAGEGNIAAPRVAMADGGTFNGSIDTTGKPGSGKS